MLARLFLGRLRAVTCTSFFRLSSGLTYCPIQPFAGKAEPKQKEMKKPENNEKIKPKEKKAASPEPKEKTKAPKKKEGSEKTPNEETKEKQTKKAPEVKEPKKKENLGKLLRMQRALEKKSRKGRTTKKTREDDEAFEMKVKSKKAEKETKEGKEKKVGKEKKEATETSPKVKEAKEKKVKKPKESKVVKKKEGSKNSLKQENFKEFENYLVDYKPSLIARRFFAKDFNKDILPTIKFLQENAKFRKYHFSVLMEKKPKLFTMLERSTSQKTLPKVCIREIHELFTKEFKFGPKSFRAFLIKYPEFFRFSREEIDEMLNYLKGNLELEPLQMKRILVINPMIFNKQLKNVVDELLKINDGFIRMSKKDLGKALSNFPFIFEIPSEQIKEDIRMLRRYNFSSEQIHKLLLTHAEFLCNKPHCLEKCFEIVKRLLIDVSDKAKEIYTENPRLFTICPTSVMPLKYRYFRNLGFNKEYLSKVFLKFPRIFIKSLKSTEMKVDYITKVHNVDLFTEETFPAILNYNYQDIIRPRGEIMKRKEKIFPWKEILDLKDEEFCKKLEVTTEELEKVKSELEVSNELESKKWFFRKYMQNNDAIIEY